MSQSIKGQRGGGNLVFLIDQKKHKPVCGEVEKMSQPIRGLGGHLVFSDRPEKTQICKRALRSCFLSSFVEFSSAVSEEK